jgi:hypothetical protein
MRERQLALPEHPQLRAEMLRLKARLTPSGGTQYATNGQDFVSALITLGHAAVEKRLTGGGFVAIDASSLRGDSFTYLCGNGRAQPTVAAESLRAGGARSERSSEDPRGQEQRRGRDYSIVSYEERSADAWRRRG